ncbi:hypothetical protein RB11432 [Rhodopirellula baltica SH 1]|uniref:Uncharacterized protein n=1 Tax=Rhodopirellula baltica (strain DSM 10527 / NCIMB 13988 / SH1) TaxID=243090 RepID=Q7UEC0_RHOBA|nr:hypothetical protein RB11432 [Rhodopirellula baltica SH 1]
MEYMGFCGLQALRVRVPPAIARSLWWNWKTRRIDSLVKTSSVVFDPANNNTWRLPVRSTWESASRE